MLKIAFGDDAKGRTQLRGFLNSNVRKIWLKISSLKIICPQVVQTKTWRKFAKWAVKSNEVLFPRFLQVRPLM
jgi:hypothetical protein